MKPDKLKKILTETEAPRIMLPSHQQELRRGLLNSRAFSRQSFSRAKAGYLLAGSALSILTVLFILPYFFAQPASAKSVIERLNASYESLSRHHAVQYLKTRIVNAGSMLPERIEEQWIAADYQEYRIRISNAQSGRVLAHAMFRDTSRYSMPDPALDLDLDLEITTADSGLAPDTSFDNQLGVRIMMEHPISGTTPVIRVLLTFGGFNHQEFVRSTPGNVAQRLRARSAIQHLGSEADPLTNRNITTLRQSLNQPNYMLRLRYDSQATNQIDTLLERIESTPGNLPAELEKHAYFNEHLLSLDTLSAIEIIRVDDARDRIYQMIRILRSGNQIIEEVVLTYLEEQYLPYDADAFDAVKLGLGSRMTNDE